MGIPVADWQFWIVTAAAFWGLVALVRTVLPDRKKKADGACPHCASGSAACAKKTDAPAGEKLVMLGGGRR
jgi:hypothetical protein